MSYTSIIVITISPPAPQQEAQSSVFSGNYFRKAWCFFPGEWNKRKISDLLTLYEMNWYFFLLTLDSRHFFPDNCSISIDLSPVSPSNSTSFKWKPIIQTMMELNGKWEQTSRSLTDWLATYYPLLVLVSPSPSCSLLNTNFWNRKH